MIKPIEQLTIVDDFMCGAVMSNPQLCKTLLEVVLGVKIREIVYPELQKVIDKRYDSKSIRLDVYVADEAGTVYNVEIQTTDKKNLPQRSRYYQGMIDLNVLEKGADYRELKRSFVIFICTYDPFGEGRYVYTFENLCRENPRIALGDQATKIFLNTKGYVGKVSAALKELLRYMDTFQPTGDYTRKLEQEVEAVRRDEKWGREYMRIHEFEREKIRLGEYKGRVELVRQSRNRFNVDELADIYYIDLKTVRAILNAIDTHPDWDDEQIAENIDFD